MSTVKHFFLAPASARPLAFLRIGLASLLLIQAYFVAPVYLELYGRMGILQGALNDFFSPGIPNSGDMVRWLDRIGVGETAALTAIGITYVLSVFLLLAGFKARLMAAVTWFLHLALTQSHTTAYGVDSYAHIMLFYLIWFPSKLMAAPSIEARLGLRVLQIHLAIAYMASGIEKGVGPQWWNGEAIWRSLILPVYRQYDFSWLAGFPWVLKILGWGTLVVEGLYPFFIFPRQTRKVWLPLTVSLHVGIAVFLGLHLFAFLMILLNVALFGVSAEPGEISNRQPEFASPIARLLGYVGRAPQANG